LSSLSCEAGGCNNLYERSIDMNKHESVNCSLVSRRRMLAQTGMGFGLLGLAGMGLFNPRRVGAAFEPADQAGRTIQPKAKRVIFLFMNGGPSHIDTFDPKPALGKFEGTQPTGKLYKKSKGSGFMPSPLKFSKHGQSGLEFSESLPQLASLADDLCIIRSMHTDVPNHEPALLQMHTGNLQPIRPSLGSWLLYGLGSENENLPGYIVLRPSSRIVVGPALWSNSFLPSEYQATNIITKDMQLEKLIADIQSPHLKLPEQRRQLNLLNRLNRIHQMQRGADAALEGQIQAMETAFRMQSEAIDVFDIEKEPQATREAYGESPFARSCLLARRLSESGVRCVTVYYTATGNQPWDTHQNHNQQHLKLCADSDRASSALLRDLKVRGLLDDTLVVWGGEFGRTPYAENRKDKKSGRDHHHTAFSMMLAGGGVKGGCVYGASDELGMHAVDNPVHVHDFHATLLHLMGLDHEALTYRWSGRDFRLTDVHGEVVQSIIA